MPAPTASRSPPRACSATGRPSPPRHLCLADEHRSPASSPSPPKLLCHGVALASDLRSTSPCGSCPCCPLCRPPHLELASKALCFDQPRGYDVADLSKVIWNQLETILK